MKHPPPKRNDSPLRPPRFDSLTENTIRQARLRHFGGSELATARPASLCRDYVELDKFIVATLLTANGNAVGALF